MIYDLTVVLFCCGFQKSSLWCLTGIASINNTALPGLSFTAGRHTKAMLETPVLAFVVLLFNFEILEFCGKIAFDVADICMWPTKPIAPILPEN